jgi:hypothetical protein
MVDIDLVLAARHIAEARQRGTSGQAALATATGTRALELLGDGRALVADADAEWTEPAQSAALALLREARHITATAALTTGQPATARDLAVAATRTDPYDEAAYRLLMRAEVALGEPARALGAYERLRKLLIEELAVDPSPETRDLHVAILREQATSTAGADDPSSMRDPMSAIAPATSHGRPGSTASPNGGRNRPAVLSFEHGVTRPSVHYSYNRSSMRSASTPPHPTRQRSARRPARGRRPLSRSYRISTRSSTRCLSSATEAKSHASARTTRFLATFVGSPPRRCGGPRRPSPGWAWQPSSCCTT